MTVRMYLCSLMMISFLFVCCNQDNAPGNTTGTLEERVFVVNVIEDAQKQNEYFEYHKKVWPEVEAGFKKAGYKKIVLYRYGSLLVMTIAVPKGADLNAMGKIAESYDPKCAQWNKLMSTYQTGVKGTKAGETWVEATPFYTFSNE
jgi:L-rhamnose mutarotase